MKNMIYVLIGISFLFSCKKENKSDQVAISGTIVTDCIGTPFANQDFVLYNQGNRFFGTGYESVLFKTDSNGNFSSKCSASDNLQPSEIRVGDSGGFSILTFNTDIDLNIGTLNINPTANYQLKIKVNNTYTSVDTLIIGDQSGLKRYKFGYPYPDTTFAITNGYSHSISIPSVESKNSVPYSVYYKIYSGQMNSVTYNEKKHYNLPKEFKGCSSQINQVELVIN